MKPRGRSITPLTEKDIEMVKAYLESDRSLEDVARQYNTSKEGLRYKVVKYRKQKDAKENQTDNT